MEPSLVTATDPESGRALTAWVCPVGDDVVVVIGGGQQPHVGSTVLAQPRPSRRKKGSWSATCSVLTIPPHKEEPIARAVAAAVAEHLGKTVVATAGVHDDDLDRQGIACYLRLGDELARSVVAHLRDLGR